MKKRFTLVIAVALLLSLSLVACSKQPDGADSKTVHKESITVKNEVPKVGPYSQMVRSNGFVYCTAQGALDPATGEMVAGGITEQTNQILDNFEAELKDAGLTLDDAVKVTVYLSDMSMFAEMNAAYAGHFNDPLPARTAIGVTALPFEDALLTMDLVAADNVDDD